MQVRMCMSCKVIANTRLPRGRAGPPPSSPLPHQWWHLAPELGGGQSQRGSERRTATRNRASSSQHSEQHTPARLRLSPKRRVYFFTHKPPVKLLFSLSTEGGFSKKRAWKALNARTENELARRACCGQLRGGLCAAPQDARRLGLARSGVCCVLGVILVTSARSLAEPSECSSPRARLLPTPILNTVCVSVTVSQIRR